MAFNTIIVEISDYIATIKLNRPDALNAINAKLLAEVCTALEEADASDKVRCIIITGSEIKSKINRYLLGSVTEKLLTYTDDIPVLIMR